MGNNQKQRNLGRNNRLRNAFLGLALLATTAIAGCKGCNNRTVEVKKPKPAAAAKYTCPAVSGILNQGESLMIDNLKFRLDDLEARGTENAAIISVLDANNNILKKDKITEGSIREITINGKTYHLTVKNVSPGYTFGARWAEIEISGKFSKPCGS